MKHEILNCRNVIEMNEKVLYFVVRYFFDFIRILKCSKQEKNSIELFIAEFGTVYRADL